MVDERIVAWFKAGKSKIRGGVLNYTDPPSTTMAYGKGGVCRRNDGSWHTAFIYETRVNVALFPLISYHFAQNLCSALQ
jgi:hypothetical protein